MFPMDQLGLFGTVIQEELPITVETARRRGNPNFRHRFKSGKTTAVRVPSIYVEKIYEQIEVWERLNPNDPQLGTNDPIFTYSGVREFPVDQLALDPERFQYKIVHGKTGSTGSLSGVQSWDVNLAGIVLVWQDPSNGIVYTVNGHNRVSLARALSVDFLTVRFLNCETSIEARVIGALANVAEGRGTAIDAAKLFRDYGFTRSQLAEKGIPLREKIACDGLALSRLHPSIFNGVIQGDYSVDRSVIIGDLIESHDQQLALLELIERESRNRRINNELIRELAESVLASENNSTEQCTLFGMEVIKQSLAIEKAELQAYIKRKLAREKRLFSTVSTARNSKDLARGNNYIDSDTSQKIATDAEVALRVFDALKNVQGPLNTALNDAAKSISIGEDSDTIKARLYGYVLRELPSLSMKLVS